MFFPLYWAESSRVIHNRRHKPSTLTRLGWSDVSPQDAQRVADERLAAAELAYAAGQDRLRDEVGGFYDGANGKPIAEPVLQRITLPDQSVAVVTRNRYGAECLNVADVMILDVDANRNPPHPFWEAAVFFLTIAVMLTILLTPSLELQGDERLVVSLIAGFIIFSLVSLLVSGLTNPPDMNQQSDRERADAAVLKSLSNHRATHPDDRFVLFRTRRGHRLILCSGRATPADLDRFSAIAIDPLYADLCRRQGGFRARLTPKPWNVGLPAIPKQRIAQPEDAAESRAAWLKLYKAASAPHAVCHHVRQNQNDESPADATIAAVLGLHDKTRTDDQGLA